MVVTKTVLGAVNFGKNDEDKFCYCYRAKYLQSDWSRWEQNGFYFWSQYCTLWQKKLIRFPRNEKMVNYLLKLKVH